LFELHPSLVGTGRAVVLDVDLRSIERLAAFETQYTPIRRYPSSAFDLSVIADLREPAGQLEATIASLAGPLTESIHFVRNYTGPPLAVAQKSVTFRLTVGSPERTLSSDEVGEIRERIIQGLRQLGYQLRV
jgi:phenylalanyl-tRNA synthetase beta chain